MTLIEKRAWFVFAVCLAAAATVILLYWFTRNARGSMAGCGLLGLSGAEPLIGLGRQRRGEVIMDERDNAISLYGAKVAFGTFWVALVAAVMGAFWIKGERATVTLDTLAMALMFAFLLIQTVRSSTILCLYRWQRGR
ncbi:MAG TPA: hypothetical protein VMU19_09830 [Bryobacteraceae bacterium]|nr:hypothetical protein [Bryobacteraceae bacterium]